MFTNLFYFVTTFLYWLHLSEADIKMWDDKNVAPSWLKSDWVYLGGALITTWLLVWSAAVTFQAVSTWYFIKATIFNTLIGSIGWDWFYGYIIDNDPLYPFEDWFAGYGFRTRPDRIGFDVIRLFIAIVIFLT